jgi:glycosyltransferase involved in cell wall biosynthesis
VQRLLYVGQVERHKGVDVAIEALALARDDGHALTLTLAGGTRDNEYEGRLRDLVSSRGLERHVDFRGAVPHAQIAALYREHDALLFPSRSPDEGLPLTLLEAMASGLPVVGTAAGGAADVLRDGENALTFAMGDARACAELVGALAGDPELVERLRKEARRRVEAEFELERTVDGIERGLVRLGAR